MHIMRQALAQGSQVLILCGSSNIVPNKRNPWAFKQRQNIINACLTAEEQARTCILPVSDLLYNNAAWLGLIQAQVKKAKILLELPEDYPVTWIGHHKDHTCDYLNDMIADKYLEMPLYEKINASEIRNAFRASDFDYIVPRVPLSTLQFLKKQDLLKIENELKQAYYFAVIHDKNIMLFKNQKGMYLPGFEVAETTACPKIQDSFLFSWYKPEDLKVGKIINFQHEHRSNSGKQTAIVKLVHAAYTAHDTGIIWSNIYRLHKLNFHHDHASIAYHMLTINNES